MSGKFSDDIAGSVHFFILNFKIMDQSMSLNHIFRAIIREENEKLLISVKELLSGLSKTTDDSKPLTIDEVCEYLSCSASYLYKLTSAKEIPHSKRGKRLFFFKAEIDKWLLEGEIKLQKNGNDALYRVLKARRA